MLGLIKKGIFKLRSEQAWLSAVLGRRNTVSARTGSTRIKKLVSLFLDHSAIANARSRLVLLLFLLLISPPLPLVIIKKIEFNSAVSSQVEVVMVLYEVRS